MDLGEAALSPLHPYPEIDISASERSYDVVNHRFNSKVAFLQQMLLYLHDDAL